MSVTWWSQNANNMKKNSEVFYVAVVVLVMFVCLHVLRVFRLEESNARCFYLLQIKVK